ncbi:hypothetical protein CKA32_005387 [Geitlerinema sp. FC II]|nr:hypothetical protein CKA32_005387 [Geitlerinema sp. FC II]
MEKALKLSETHTSAFSFPPVRSPPSTPLNPAFSRYQW